MSTSALPSRHMDLPQLEYRWPVSLGPQPAALSSRDLLALTFKWKYFLIVTFLLPLISAIILLIVLPPSYRAQTSLVVGTGHEYLAQGDGSATMTAPTSTKQEFINTEIELLNNISVAKATIERVGLANIYPAIASAHPEPGSAMDAALKAFKSSLRVDPVKLSNLINVTFSHGNPQMASSVLDQFIASYQDLHAKVFSSRRARSYEETIGRDTQELAKLEHERAAVKAGDGIFDIGQQRSALIFQRVDAQKHLQDTIDQQSRLQDRLTYLTDVRPHIPSEIRSVQTDKRDETVHARQLLFDLQAKEIALLGSYNEHSPVVERVRMQISTLKRIMDTMSDTLSRVSTSPSPITTAIDQEMINSKAELTPLRAQEERYKALIVVIGESLRRIEQGDSKLRILDAHIEAQNENLKAMRKLYDQARAEDEMELAKVTSVVQTSRAISPNKPVAPIKALFLAVGVLIGLIVSAGVLVFTSILSRTFISEESLERFLHLPVLGSVPLRTPDLKRLA